MKLSADVQISLSVAVTEAARLGHEYAGTEHLLYALTFDEDTARVLTHAGADVQRLRERLAGWLGDQSEEDVTPYPEPRLSLALQRALGRAGVQVEGSGREEVAGPDLLVALFAEPDSHAVALLAAEGVTRLDVVSYLAHGVSRLEGGEASDGEASPDDPRLGPRRLPASPAGDDPEAPEDDPRDPDALAAFTRDLVALAREGRIDPLVGREPEIRRALHVLRRRRKNNPVFVGDPGVGKTALVEGLAWKIARGERDVPEAFADTRIFSLDLGALLAGTRYRGDFENRVKAVVNALEALPGSGGTDPPVLFIDEIHTLIGAGSAGRGTMDASSLLKPALEQGALRVIGATTWEEFRQTFERDRALARRFQKIEVGEPSIDETVAIFHGLRERYEAHHGVSFTRRAVETAAELAERHLGERRLPDKAIDVLDEAAAAVALAGRRRVGPRDVERIVSSWAGVPVDSVERDDRERLARLETALEERVFGQDEAVERLAASVRAGRAGLRAPERPVGAFLLTGPTGVGKTELARSLADVLGIELLRFDMSEYMERHTVSRLVGAPPGYVGYDRGGLLTEAVARHPHAVLLLDEIEKAHPDVFNLLLQVMDHGTLTDTNGKKADFRHVVLLMTSNAGARELARRAPGFSGAHGGAGSPASGGDGSEREVERLFSPEFRNRLDARLAFRPLTPEVMERIVDKMVGELAARLAAKGVELELTPDARALLAERGFDPTYGARPLARVLEETVQRPLADSLLFGELADGGGRALVEVEAGELRVRVE